MSVHVARLLVAPGALVLSGSLLGILCAQNPPTPAPPAPPAIVSGVFVDSIGAPIPHAVLSVVGESLRVVTDEQGRFRLQVPPGPRLLAARALGYRPLMWSVMLVSGEETSGRIRLHHLSVLLPELTVVGERLGPNRLAGFYQRKRIGFGKYLDSADVNRRPVMRAGDLLQTIAGVRVMPDPSNPFMYQVTFARCRREDRSLRAPSMLGPFQQRSTSPNLQHPEPSVVGVYVDGFRVLGEPGEVLGMINAADIEAIEVYRGPSELPAEFMSDDCAAIVIWTKY